MPIHADANRDKAESGRHRQTMPTVIVLSVLAFLFCIRILSQFVQTMFDVSGLPAFERWQSGTVSYAILLSSQVVLIVLMIAAIAAVAKGRGAARLGVALCAVGSVYLAVMAGRAIAGYFELSNLAWLNHPLPTAFHIVIASFILVLGWHWAAPLASGQPWHRIPRKVAPVLDYPLIMLCAMGLFVWAVREGIGQGFAAYLAVALGASFVLAHELLLPYRRQWLPASETVAWDAVYLVVVQVLLPAVLSFVVVGGLVWGLAAIRIDPVGFWPHHWPLLAQVVAMMLMADLLRYWLHRMAHKVRWLWALHAVHHSPKVLYSLNVGRFHPGDKALQFLLDALPFALMGVSGNVLAAYFVFYAINGFFQHSNANVKLGPLNWIIAGPELHRWHHAKAYEHANCNFGNNLIIWDALFGTRFLPPREQVGELGIGNSNYPEDLVGQTLAPFVSSPDVDAPR